MAKKRSAFGQIVSLHAGQPLFDYALQLPDGIGISGPLPNIASKVVEPPRVWLIRLSRGGRNEPVDSSVYLRELALPYIAGCEIRIIWFSIPPWKSYIPLTCTRCVFPFGLSR